MDLNGDGFKDILSGSYSRNDGGGVAKMAGLFQVLWGSRDGFKEAEVLKGSDGQPLIIGSPSDWTDKNIIDRVCTRPMAVDWDNDGKLDLVVGNFGGEFYLFKGEGSGVFKPKAEKLLTADGKPLQVNQHGDPMVIDWDGDGDLDIVSGSAGGGVYFAENIGTRTTPKFKQFVEWIKPVPLDEKMLDASKLKNPLHDTRVWVDDFNGDGKLDLIVGDRVRLCGPAPGLTVEQSQAKHDEWDQKFEELWAKREKVKDDAAAVKKLDDEIDRLEGTRDEFIRETYTGFVWLYLQK